MLYCRVSYCCCSYYGLMPCLIRLCLVLRFDAVSQWEVWWQNYSSPLQWAATNGFPEVVQLLIASGSRLEQHGKVLHPCCLSHCVDLCVGHCIPAASATVSTSASLLPQPLCRPLHHLLPQPLHHLLTSATSLPTE